MEYKASYFKNRASDLSVDLTSSTAKFPENALIELSNACNHFCVFCNNPRMKRKVNILDGDGGGSDKPRCKISLGEIDFLANISKKMDGKFSVEIIGDTTLRDTIRKELPGIDFNFQTFTRQEFANFANKLYKWGERQPEKCRFYVKVDRKKINTLDDIDFIGRYFYKSYGRK